MKATLLLLVATLGLQAQTPVPPSQPNPPEQPQPFPPDRPQPIPSGSSATRNSSGKTTTTEEQRKEEERRRNDSTLPSQNRSGASPQTFNQQSTTQINRSGVSASAETDVQVQTVVQQIDAQGPAVVQRISTRFADVACSEENARLLVEALHSGSSVTLRGDDGQTATFTPNVQLGYGEAYIAMALAAEALQDAGISGCATPAQWQAVLMGGQLSGGTTRTTSVQTERFPGILVLHSQGGGWTKVAQTTNVELHQVVNEANTSLQIDNSNELSPTGHPSDYDPYKQGGQDKNKAKSKDEKDSSKPDTPQTPGQKMNPPGADDPNNPSRTEQPQARPYR